MKNLIGVLLLLSLYSIRIYSQTTDVVCDLEQMYANSIQTTKTANQYGIVQGGKYKTASGTIRVPIIFVRFKDDTLNNNNWPSYDNLPDWAANLVDSEIPANGVYQKLNISNFFNRESGGNNNGILGNFQMIGDVYYVTTNGKRTDYRNDAEVNKHVIQKLDSMGVNFAQYDNWEFMVNNEEYIHNYIPYNQTTGEGGDGEIDHIFIFWRGPSLVYPSNVGGYNSIGIYYTTTDSTLIFPRSGSTQFGMLDRGGPWTSRKLAVSVPAHEYCHFLFGGHNNSDAHWDGRTTYLNKTINTGNIRFFALMTSAEGISMCAYEKYRLGWLQPTPIISNSNYTQLYDTHIYNKSIIIPLRYENNVLVESYFIENFQTVNSYNGANPFKISNIFNHVIKHGILVYHIENENQEYPTFSDIDIECADGLWDWGLSNGEDTPTDRSDDHLIQTISNRDNGLDERDYIPLTVGNIFYDDYMALTPSSGASGNHGRRYDSDDWLGDTEDFFKENYATVFSPWSNPSTILNNGQPSNFGFEILHYDNFSHKYILKFGFDSTTVISFSPTKVQNFSANFNGTHPILTWDANLEPDLHGYRVYKKLTLADGQTSTSSIFTTNTSYTDYDFTIKSGRFASDEVEYWVVAEDNSGKLSVESNHYGTRGSSNIQWKPIANNNIKDYKISQNYPNPFNPSTVIKYQLPKDSFVNLSVYNSLGQRVKVLVNSKQSAGYYTVNFDASSVERGLPSGIYFYTIKAGNYISTKKMLLVK